MSSDFMMPKAAFLTKGVGRHKEKLASFEEALRDAKIARFNLVTVSSIFPPQCKLITPAKGLQQLKSGQIVHAVLSRCETNENRRLIAVGIGLAIPADRKQHGYISEHHSYGENEDQAGEYTEDLAAWMLATVQGVHFDADSSWDEKKEIWKLSGKIVRTTNVTQSAIGVADEWTTVVASAVFLF